MGSLRPLAISLCVAAVAALTVTATPIAPAQAAAGACRARSSGSSMVTRFRTFTVKARPLKTTYPADGTAVVEVTVTRPGEEDPLNNGVPLNSPVSLPAEDVDVSVGLYRGNFYMYGVGITDAEGKALIKIKLNPYAPAGSAIGEAGARKYYNRGGCPDIEEEGFAYYPRFFRTTD